jgi:hypothetical protein
MSVNGKSIRPNQGFSTLANPAPADGSSGDHAEPPNGSTVPENKATQGESSLEMSPQLDSVTIRAPHNIPPKNGHAANHAAPHLPIIPRLPKPAAAVTANTLPINTITRI